MLEKIKKVIPNKLFRFLQPTYHYFLAFIGAVIYSFPSRKLIVIGVTGTKGKSTTTEILNSIFEQAGWKTALQNTIRFKVGDKEERNVYKMSMPGRFFIQNFLHRATLEKCNVAILELTSEGAKQFRNKFVDLDALIFTNLAPEHIESHGSYKNYVEAKISIARELQKRKKKGSALIVNIDDKEAQKFLELNVEKKIRYSLSDAVGIKSDEKGSSFQIDKVVVHSRLPGIFNVQNILGAMACAKHFGISAETSKIGIESLSGVRGRMEKVNVGNLSAEGFDVVVDYAHTPDSLKAVYEAYKGYKKICILGNTGGGRDTWKRPEMGKIADKYCTEIILTNEDPYDEDPKQIVEDVKKGIKKKPVEIIMDRREAIRLALHKATEIAQTKPSDKVAVLITGKGTDPYIMGPNGSKQEWDDASVAREELNKILDNRK